MRNVAFSKSHLLSSLIYYICTENLIPNLFYSTIQLQIRIRSTYFTRTLYTILKRYHSKGTSISDSYIRSEIALFGIFSRCSNKQERTPGAALLGNVDSLSRGSLQRLGDSPVDKLRRFDTTLPPTIYYVSYAEDIEPSRIVYFGFEQ